MQAWKHASRSGFSTKDYQQHRNCMDRHKRQRVLLESVNGVNRVVSSETIQFVPGGIEQYTDDVSGVTHRLNRLTGACSCGKENEWKCVVPSVLRHLIHSHPHTVDAVVQDALPSSCLELRDAWPYLLDMATSIDSGFATIDPSEVVSVTFIHSQAALALERVKDNKILWTGTISGK